MNARLKRLFVLALVVPIYAACGADTGDTGTDDVTIDDTEPTSETRTTPASLEGALPADGQVLTGEFMLAAVVDAQSEVEVRFLVDGSELAVVNELPYQVRVDGCDLSPGNHAYVVEVRDTDGQRDFVEQWFEVSNCD